MENLMEISKAVYLMRAKLDDAATIDRNALFNVAYHAEQLSLALEMAKRLGLAVPGLGLAVPGVEK